MPVRASADRFFDAHSANVDPTAAALAIRILNEIWRFSSYLDEVPAFVEVECLIEVCRASVEFPRGHEDALAGVPFGIVQSALSIELYEHGIVNVSPGLPDTLTDLRNMYLWRQAGTRPEWDAYLPVISQDLKEILAQGLRGQGSIQ